MRLVIAGILAVTAIRLRTRSATMTRFHLSCSVLAQALTVYGYDFRGGMVLEKIADIIQPDTTYTYECYDCGEEFTTDVPRELAECPECGGQPVVPDEA